MLSENNFQFKDIVIRPIIKKEKLIADGHLKEASENGGTDKIKDVVLKKQFRGNSWHHYDTCDHQKISRRDPSFHKAIIHKKKKLDGVGPNDNRPSSNYPHHFVKKKKRKEKKIVRSDTV